MPRILISGAGIAGLALARCLEQAGMDYVLLDTVPAPVYPPCGIALPFNAIAALRYMGLAERVLEQAWQVDEVIYARADGTTISRANLRAEPYNREPFVALHRHQLHTTLVGAIHGQVHYNTQITGLEQQSDSVIITCSDEQLSGDYDLVVAAEGINSPLRARCFPDEATQVNHPIPNWRFVIRQPNHGLQPIYLLDGSELFMAYPISRDELYCYAHFYDAGQPPSQHSAAEILRSRFGHFGGPVPALLAQLESARIIPGRLKSVARPYFRHGRIVFVGDAGNGCSPLLQQGAAAAFEDVIALAHALSQQPVWDAISQYEQCRRERVRWVLAQSDNPLKLIKHFDHSLGRWLRDTVVRLGGPLNAQGWRGLLKQAGGLPEKPFEVARQ